MPYAYVLCVLTSNRLLDPSMSLKTRNKIYWTRICGEKKLQKAITIRILISNFQIFIIKIFSHHLTTIVFCVNIPNIRLFTPIQFKESTMFTTKNGIYIVTGKQIGRAHV